MYKFVIFLSFLVSALFSEESPSLNKISVHEISEMGVTELILPSGMKVFLKPLDSEEGIVSLQMAAPGGYSGFADDLKVSAQMVPDAVWYSGIADLDGNQLSQMLYDESLDFNYYIEPHYHYLVGEAYTENTERLFQLITDFFQKPKFTESGLKELIGDEVDELAIRDRDPYSKIERNFYKLNGLKETTYYPKLLAEIHQVTLDKVRTCYNLLFGNPQDFVLVIAGDFEVQTIVQQLEKTLAQLKKGDSPKIPERAVVTKEITKGETLIVEGKSEKKASVEALSRLTFQIPLILNSESFPLLELLTQAIEVEVREVIKRKLGNTSGVDVSIEIPLYPLMINPWLIVQFHAPRDMIEPLSKTILLALNKMHQQGLAQETVLLAEQNLRSSDSFWEQEASYWLNMLTNDYLFKWDPLKAYKYKQSIYDTSKEPLNNLLKQLKFDQYTLFIANIGDE